MTQLYLTLKTGKTKLPPSLLLCHNVATHDGRSKRKNKTNTTQSTKDRTAQRKYPVVIPYIKGLSEAVSRIMKKHGISTTMKPCNKLRDILVHPKDKIKEMDKAQGVYKVPCQSCKSSYIGETSRKLSTCIDEHKKDGQKLDGQSYTRSQRASASQVYNKSAITDHTGKENHVINWEGTRLIARESQDLNRCIKEAIWIKRTPHNMNRDGGAHQLSDIYDAAITRASCLGER